MFDQERCEAILALLKRQKAKGLLLQVPEGLKTGVQNLINFLEKNEIECILSLEPCFGACDLRDHEAKLLGCDTLLHIGHANLGLKTDMPIVYYEYLIDYDFIPLLKMIIRKVKYRRICLVSTIQFKKGLESARKFLGKRGFIVKMADPILGCNIADAKAYERMVECYLFIGSGRFHPLGLQEKTSKPVLFLDIENRILEDLSEEKEKMEIKKGLRIEKAKGLQNFGIVVSTKPGQLRRKEADEIKRKLIKRGKWVYMLAADQLTPEKLLGLKIDVLINTACPRIREDAEQFGKVILNLEDVEEMD